MRTLAASLLVILVSTTVYAQPTTFQREDLVRVKPAPHGSDVATRMPLRVVAIAGDRLRIADGVLYVNDVPVSGLNRDFIYRVAQQPDRVPNVVPVGHCFVMGEQRTNQDVSEYWGQHSDLSLERAR
jgi:signal peptidase S26 family